MKPRILTIDPNNIDIGLIKQAAEAIHNRGLVAFPTETVYGLGANALDSRAVTGIFEAKKRPLDDPLILHISKIDDLFLLAKNVPPEAEKLVNRFWPGPLTVVLEKTDMVSDIISTGLETVAVRMPSNPIAKKLIELSDVPIAAPSANLFGKPSPTSAKHVMDDLKGRIDIILDGGPTEIGVESTVIEFVEGRSIILRPGGVEVDLIKEIAGDVEIASEGDHTIKSPGKYPQHYSPNAKVILVEKGPQQVDELLSQVKRLTSEGHKAGILASQGHEEYYKTFNVKVLGPGENGEICASRLFHLLREFDSEGVDIIAAEEINEEGLGLAVMNRLRKAAGPDPE
ncbi:MAG: threonylcarbamoyl-AMP synthase [Candidatus Omnitrophica bacterium]|nr:threonylcarbamoyl-AMP synthase [Candidatus Omnitrophota bacterium]